MPILSETLRSRFALSFASLALSLSLQAQEPSQTLPEGWQSQDLGTCNIAGQTTINEEGQIQVTGSGTNYTGRNDNAQYFYRTLNGKDGEIIVRLDSLVNGANSALAGIDIRQELAKNSVRVSLLSDKLENVQVSSRFVKNTDHSSTPITVEPAPIWLRLQRQENTFKAWTSIDGKVWENLSETELEMAEDVYIGLISASFDQTNAATATFSNLQIFSPVDQDGDGLADYDEINLFNTDPSLADSDGNGQSDLYEADSDNDGISDGDEIANGTDPLRENLPLLDGWKTMDIGNVTTPGSVTRYSSSYDIVAYANPAGATDAGQYLYQELDGNFSIKVRIDSQEGAKTPITGLSIRQTTDARSSMVYLESKSGKGVTYYERGGANQSRYKVKSDANLLDPTWLRLVRFNGKISAYTSTNGNTWTHFATYTDTPVDVNNGPVCVGVLTSSGSSSKKAKAKITNLSIDAVEDKDNDGIPNMEEINFYGTKWKKADTDADTRSDYEELYTYATDPLRPELPLAEGWSSIALGSVGENSAAYSFENGDIHLAASGTGFVGAGVTLHETDSGLFAYKALTGDFQVTVERKDREVIGGGDVESALMLRADLTPGSTFVAQETGVKATFLHRLTEGTASIRQSVFTSDAKFYRLVRVGDRLISFVSADGLQWQKRGEVTHSFPETAYVGIMNSTEDLNDMEFSTYSQPLIETPIDSDADGLLDIEETYSIGTDSQNADTDADGTSDGAEMAQGLSPHHPETLVDGIAVHKHGLITSYYLHEAKKDMPDFEGLSSFKLSIDTELDYRAKKNEVLDDSGRIDYVAVNSKGYIHIPETGAYNFYLTVNQGGKVTIGDQVILDTTGKNTEAYAATPSIQGVQLEAGWQPINVVWYHHVNNKEFKLEWESANLTREVITSKSLMHSQVEADAQYALLDTDEDGLRDLKEIEIGTNPNHKDSDGDGLIDSAELTAGTNPLLADTDGDGVNDGIEVNETFTDALAQDFDGTVTTVQTVLGKDTVNSQGTWEVDGTTAVAKRRRGFVEYEIDVPENDVYLLNLTATHDWLKYSCSPISPIDNSDIQFFVDGDFVTTKNLIAPDGVYGSVGFITPQLNAGKHTIRVHWENVHSRISLRVKELEVQSLGGPDADNNGKKDWIETAIAKQATLDAVPATSFISPLSIEGQARYVSKMGTHSTSSASPIAALQGAGDRWYANIPLSETESTDISVSFQSGALTRTASTQWTALDLFASANAQTLTDGLVLRQGDSLKLSAASAGLEGDVSWAINETASNQTVATEFTQAFREAGDYTVKATFAGVEKSLSIKVLAPIQPKNSDGTDFVPACMLGLARNFTTTDLPVEAVIESDDTVEVIRDGENLSVTVKETNKPHHLVIRAYENGPVLSSLPLEIFWVQAAVDNRFWVVERHDDYELWENEIVTKNVPDSIVIQIRINIAGAMLEDGTMLRDITNTDLDELGEYKFLLIHPNSLDHSTCHSIFLYQDGVKLGQAVYGGKLLGDVKE